MLNVKFLLTRVSQTITAVIIHRLEEVPEEQPQRGQETIAKLFKPVHVIVVLITGVFIDIIVTTGDMFPIIAIAEVINTGRINTVLEA